MERLSHSLFGSGQAVNRALDLQGCPWSGTSRLGRRLLGGILRWNLPHHPKTHLRRHLRCHGSHFTAAKIALQRQIWARVGRPSLFARRTNDGLNSLLCFLASAPSSVHRGRVTATRSKTERSTRAISGSCAVPNRISSARRIQYNIWGCAIDRRYIRLYCNHPSERFSVTGPAPAHGSGGAKSRETSRRNWPRWPDPPRLNQYEPGASTFSLSLLTTEDWRLVAFVRCPFPGPIRTSPRGTTACLKSRIGVFPPSPGQHSYPKKPDRQIVRQRA